MGEQAVWKSWTRKKLSKLRYWKKPGMAVLNQGGMVQDEAAE